MLNAQEHISNKETYVSNPFAIIGRIFLASLAEMGRLAVFAGTALLHSALVMEKRNALKIWTILLAILTFSLSLLGTFMVRSGILTSVHSFASDPTRGLVILGILAFFICGAFVLFAIRGPALRAGGLAGGYGPGMPSGDPQRPTHL